MKKMIPACTAAIALAVAAPAAMAADPIENTHMELEGADVLSIGGKVIGEVEDAIIDGTGRVVGVVVEFGDFFDFADREVLIMLSDLDYSEKGFVTDMTEAEAEALVEWDSEIDEMNIVDINGHEIGDVEKALVDRSGRIGALVVEVGGFLGLGEHEVAMPMDRLEFTKGGYMTRMSKAEIKNLPEWNG